MATTTPSNRDQAPQKVLVTGAGGFIGSRVCSLLSSRGAVVVAVDRRFAASQPYPHLSGDIGSLDFLDEVMRAGPFDAIVHLAGLLNTASRRQPDEALRVNIGGSLALLQSAVQAKVQKFIFGSSISVYGPMPFAEYGEVSEGRPAAPSNVYGLSKRFVEMVGEEHFRQGTIQFTALRIAMVVGPGALYTSTPWRSAIFEQLRAAQPVRIELPFAPTERLPLIHVAEVAEAILQLLLAGHPIHSIYNSPVENLQAGGLAEMVRSINPQIEIAYHPARDRGDPEAINGQRFSVEFGCQPVPVQQHLRSWFQEIGS